MPTFSITDNLGKPVDSVKVDWTNASSLFQYLKSELLHLVVLPDYLARVDEPLTQAAPDPIRFELKVGNTFQLGNTQPEISITPAFKAVLHVNTTKDSNLFEDDAFQVAATVPENAGYVGLKLTGALDLGVSGSSGELTFGFDNSNSVTLEYLKAFPTGSSQPKLGEATGQMLSSYQIPSALANLEKLNVGDICSVSGTGSLKVSGGISISTPANPLASVNLPLGVGALEVNDGVMAGLTASFTISGSYQVRVRRLPAGSLELSYLREKGTAFQTDLTTSAGVSVTVGSTDLLSTLLGAISTNKVDQSLLAGLSANDIATFNGVIKDGVDHSLQASLDLGFSAATDDTATFQYEIHPGLLDDNGRTALGRALKGDLCPLTELESTMQPDGTLAPGIKMLNSVLNQMRSHGVSMKVNLLGIVNLISVSNLISNCEFLTDPANGGLTIKETARSERISAITDPLDRQESLRKAIFNAVTVTTTYRASQAVVMPELACSNVHFAENTKTSGQNITDYLDWFAALDLLAADEKTGIAGQWSGGGRSTCLLRTEFDDPACEALFFDGSGNLRTESDYEEIGRRALAALLDTTDSDINRFRYRFLEDTVNWPKALEMGPSSELGALLPIPSTHPQYNIVLSDVIGDVYDIRWWAKGMCQAGEALRDMRTFLAGRNPIALADDEDFRKHREALQKVMLDMVGKSKLRFHEPWGMVCLFWAAGSRQSYGKLAAGKLVVERTRTAVPQPLGMPAHS